MCNFPCNYSATNQNMTRVYKLDDLLVNMCHYLILFVFSKLKFHWIISIVKVFATRMVTRGTPQNVH
jgi:hypothetical protein